MGSRLNQYRTMIRAFLDAGYSFIPFLAAPPAKGGVILRHDIDFDVLLAEKMADLEHAMGVRATYFFMLRSSSYNLLETRNAAAVERIRHSQHAVSLHFDPCIYDDFAGGLERELALFEKLFNFRPDCISIHRPNEFFLTCDAPIGGLRHTYQSLYCGQTQYYSDSQGAFRYGHPLESEAFRQRQSIHLLIHPVWWVTDETAPLDILGRFLDERVRRFQAHMAANCKPYRAVTGEPHE